MGKRKTKKIKPSNAALALKRRGKLDKVFLCHYCQHEGAVSVKIDMQSGVGLLSCRVCSVNFSTKISSLDEPIDVYTTWMDKCRESTANVSDNKSNKDDRNPSVSSKKLVSDARVSENTEHTDAKSNKSLESSIEDRSERSTKLVSTYGDESEHEVAILNHRRKMIRDTDEATDNNFIPYERSRSFEKIANTEIKREGISGVFDDNTFADVRAHNLFDDDE